MAVGAAAARVRYAATMVASSPRRAVILAIGSELTSGETRDTNSGDIAADLSRMGVRVVRMAQLPDDLDAVAESFRWAIETADLVVSTGGLGPTPDDLTREALAQALGETPTVDPDLERWLLALFERRGMRMPATNRKQAWLIPSAEALPNRHGTAPGWWVERDGQVLVALPGPPREARPMWLEDVLPRLQERGLGAEVAVRTLRLTGIGESHVAEALGERLLRAENPIVATYARHDAVDVRITARPATDEDGGSRSAAELLDETQRIVEAALREHVFARDDETWPDVLGQRLDRRRVATWERGTGGVLAALLGNARWFTLGEVDGRPSGRDEPREDLATIAGRMRERSGAEVGVAGDARADGHDTGVCVAIDLDGVLVADARTAFLDGEQGRHRAALAACALLWQALGTAVGSAAGS